MARIEAAMFCFSVTLMLALGAASQSDPTRIKGVDEPPELLGQPPDIPKSSDVEELYFKVVGQLVGKTAESVDLVAINAFLSAHPSYSGAYYERAVFLLCTRNSHDYPSILKDADAAITTQPLSPEGIKFSNLTEFYSLRAKLNFLSGQYKAAADDLELAMKVDISSPGNFFNSHAIDLATTSTPCEWDLTDLDALVLKLPRDFRPLLFRGLYYNFFTNYTHNYSAKAIAQFQHASLLNPKSPLPLYFIAGSHMASAFWSINDSVQDALRKQAIQSLTPAIHLDPKFVPAYEARASEYLALKQYAAAITDFGKVLELDPDHKSALSDRGIAYLETARYIAAVADFTDAIRLTKEGDLYLPNLYENRGDAYTQLREYQHAIDDYSKAIAVRFGMQLFLLNLKQIRGLYPEYSAVSDDLLIRKLQALFWPAMDYDKFAEHIRSVDGKWTLSLLNEDYEKRGDAYLRMHDFRHGVLDFKRIFDGIPAFAESTDRWRQIGTTSAGDNYYLDVKTAEFPATGVVQMWVKTIEKKRTLTAEYQLQCKTRMLNTISGVVYDSAGKLLQSSDLDTGWQRVVPDSIGEGFYQGACSTVH